jgi:hypothetical protein
VPPGDATAGGSSAATSISLAAPSAVPAPIAPAAGGRLAGPFATWTPPFGGGRSVAAPPLFAAPPPFAARPRRVGTATATRSGSDTLLPSTAVLGSAAEGARAGSTRSQRFRDRAPGAPVAFRTAAPMLAMPWWAIPRLASRWTAVPAVDTPDGGLAAGMFEPGTVVIGLALFALIGLCGLVRRLAGPRGARRGGR